MPGDVTQRTVNEGPDEGRAAKLTARHSGPSTKERGWHLCSVFRPSPAERLGLTPEASRLIGKPPAKAERELREREVVEVGGERAERAMLEGGSEGKGRDTRSESRTSCPVRWRCGAVRTPHYASAMVRPFENSRFKLPIPIWGGSP